MLIYAIAAILNIGSSIFWAYGLFEAFRQNAPPAPKLIFGLLSGMALATGVLLTKVAIQ